MLIYDSNDFVALGDFICHRKVSFMRMTYSPRKTSAWVTWHLLWLHINHSNFQEEKGFRSPNKVFLADGV